MDDVVISKWALRIHHIRIGWPLHLANLSLDWGGNPEELFVLTLKFAEEIWP